LTGKEPAIGPALEEGGGETLRSEEKPYGKGEMMTEWVKVSRWSETVSPKMSPDWWRFWPQTMRYLTGQISNVNGGLIFSFSVPGIAGPAV